MAVEVRLNMRYSVEKAKGRKSAVDFCGLENIIIGRVM